jgi:hypothetical protein
MDRRWVSRHKATEMVKYGILLLPKVEVLKGFGASLGGVPMSSVPKGVNFDAAVGDTIRKEKLCQERETWAPEYLLKRFREEREAALVHFMGE